MVNTRSRRGTSPGGHGAVESTADQPHQAPNTEPPIPNMLVGRVEVIPRAEIVVSEPVLEEEDPETRMMNRMMKAMTSAMTQQQEFFMKLMEDRDASNRKHEVVAENVGGTGSGGENDIPTNDGVTNEVKQGSRGCSYKTFLCCKPPEFAGSDNPAACMKWLREIEQAFRSCDCEENQKVKYASQLLRGNALTWWNIFVSTMEATVLAKLSWASFKKKILEEYCTEQEMDLIEEEFRSLKKGSSTVREYTQVFMEKLSLVGHVAPTEKEKVKAYLKGLPAEMMAMVRNSKATNLRETIEEAKVMERVYASEKKEKESVGGEKEVGRKLWTSQKVELQQQQPWIYF